MAGIKCPVPGCQNTSRNSNFSFHQIPLETSRREQWMKILNMVDNTSATRPRICICGAHFKRNQFTSRGRTHLTKTAVPFNVKSKSRDNIATASSTVRSNVPTVGPVSAEFARSLPNVRVVLSRLPDVLATPIPVKKQVIQSGKSLTATSSTSLFSTSQSQRATLESQQSKGKLTIGKPIDISSDEYDDIKPDLESLSVSTSIPTTHSILGLPYHGQTHSVQLPRFETPGHVRLVRPQPSTPQTNQPRMQSLIQIRPLSGIGTQIQQVGQQQQTYSVQTNTTTLAPGTRQQTCPINTTTTTGGPAGLTYVFLGTGVNGLPCFAQIQTPQTPPVQIAPTLKTPVVMPTMPIRMENPPLRNSSISQCGPTPSTSSGEVSAPTPLLLSGPSTSTRSKGCSMIDTNKEHSDDNFERNTSRDWDCPKDEFQGPTVPCIMCNTMIFGDQAKAPPEDTPKIFKSLLKILKLTEEEDDPYFMDDPSKIFCLYCYRQVSSLVETYNQLIILQDRFRSLKKDVLTGLSKSFCQRKAEEESDETIKDWYNVDGVPILHEIIGKWNGSKSRRVEARPRIDLTNVQEQEQIDHNLITESYDQTDENESQSLQEPMDMEAELDNDGWMADDFELEQLEEEMPNNSENTILNLPEDTGEVEIGLNRKTRNILRIAKRWEALFNCPKTRTGVEKLLPLYLRRVTCPICNEKLTPYANVVNKHLTTKHRTLRESVRDEIKTRLLSVSTERLNGMERAYNTKRKWKMLSKCKDADTLNIPISYKFVNCPVCDKRIFNSNLRCHLNIHTGEKPYKCTLCPRQFAHRSNLSTHRSSHTTPEVPFTLNSYFCDFCSKYHKYRASYVTHLFTRHSEYINVSSEILYFYNCDYDGCLKSFRHTNDFVEHLDTHGNSAQCPSCEKVFASPQNLEEHSAKFHVQNIEGTTLFDCKYCPQIFEDEKKWKDHELTHAIDMSCEQRTHLCHECGRSYKTKIQLTAHHKTHAHRKSKISKSREENHKAKSIAKANRNTSKHNCQICKEGFQTNVALSNHLLDTHTYDHPLFCYICQANFMNLSAFQRHIRQEHPSMPWSKTWKGNTMKHKPQRVACQVCGESVYKRALTNHLLDIHTYENKLSCYICQEPFKKITILERHIRRHLGQPRKTPKEVCIYCQEEFPRCVTLRKHCVNKHTEQYLAEKPYYCPICFLRFENDEELSQHHLKFHEKWKCTVCGKQLRNRFTFEYHAKIHTAEKPFQCRFCDKAFASMTNMKEHEMRHKGEKPHVCEYCQVGFFRKNKLREHVETVHG